MKRKKGMERLQLMKILINNLAQPEQQMLLGGKEAGGSKNCTRFTVDLTCLTTTHEGCPGRTDV